MDTSIVDAAAEALEAHRMLIEAAAGYRSAAIAAGFTEIIAEQMALGFHQTLLMRTMETAQQ